MALSKPKFISDRVEDGRYFFLNVDSRSRSPLRVVCGGREQCGPRYLINRNGFRYWALEYVRSGQLELTLGQHRHTVGPGMVFVYGPGIPHRMQTTGAERLDKYFVDFCGHHAGELIQESGLANSTPCLLRENRWVQELFEQLLESGNARPTFAKQHTALLLRVILNRITEDSVAVKRGDRGAFETFVNCRDYLIEHCLKLQTAAEIARACQVDPAYLSRLFKRYEGEGVYAFLIRRKIQRSAELLVGQNMKVSEAGQAVGFEDPYHFSRVFKRIYGLAPRHFVEKTNRNQVNDE